MTGRRGCKRAPRGIEVTGFLDFPEYASFVAQREKEGLRHAEFVHRSITRWIDAVDRAVSIDPPGRVKLIRQKKVLCRLPIGEYERLMKAMEKAGIRFIAVAVTIAVSRAV